MLLAFEFICWQTSSSINKVRQLFTHIISLTLELLVTQIHPYWTGMTYIHPPNEPDIIIGNIPAH